MDGTKNEDPVMFEMIRDHKFKTSEPGIKNG